MLFSLRIFISCEVTKYSYPGKINSSLISNITKETIDTMNGLLLCAYVFVGVASLLSYAGQNTVIHYYECTCHWTFDYVTLTQLQAFIYSLLQDTHVLPVGQECMQGH